MMKKTAAGEQPNYFKSWVEWSGIPIAIALLATLTITLPYTSPAAVPVIAGLAILVASFFRYDLLLYFMVFLLPVAPLLQIGDFPVHDVVSLMRILMFAGVLAKKLLDGEPLRQWFWRSRIEKLALVFCLIAVISATVTNPVDPASIRSLFRLTSYVLFYYSLTGWLNSEAQLRRMIGVLFASTITICVLGFDQVILNDFGTWFYWLYTGQEQYIEPWQTRITSVFLHVNPFAAYLNLVLPLALAAGTSLVLGSFLRRAGRICFFVATLALLLTQSRGAFLGFVCFLGIALWSVVKQKSARSKLVLTVLMAFVFAAIVVQVSSDSVGTTTASASDRLTGLDETTLTRIYIYATAWNLFTSAPFLGIGYGNFKSRLNPSIAGGPDNVWDTHNLYLKLLSETGTIGFLCFMALIFFAVQQTRQSLKDNSAQLQRVFAVALLGALVSLLVHGLVDVMIDVPQFGSLLWLIFAMFTVANRIGQKEAAIANLSGIPALSGSRQGC
ncbi:MAG: O-antigen ligase RfaL [Acidobacteriales bacterium]|nr:O-antigen ligase RfaL [Terriglobales bacterium]